MKHETRNDIQGLRAIAVISVLIYHFKIFGFKSGFIGVDIFFVISGYLMTSVIFNSMVCNSFSILEFYIARLRRILPAFLFLIVLLSILGWFFLTSMSYSSLGIQSASSLLFLSNIYFWKTSGYFDSASEEKWLLHTWSLSIEAQFYIIYPLIILFALRLFGSKKIVTIFLFILMLISFSMIYLTKDITSSASFYLIHTRLWELLTGGFVFLLMQQTICTKKQKAIFHYSGIIFLCLGLFVIESSMLWPSYWTLLPVLGTSLIIFSERNTLLLTNNVMSWIGDRSYSLYLYHWPLAVLLNYFYIGQNIYFNLAAIILSFVFADLSYRFIENPSRKIINAKPTFSQYRILIISILPIFIISISIKFLNFDSRLPLRVKYVEEEQSNNHKYKDECHLIAEGNKGSPGCEFGNFDDVGLLVIGDSHALSIISPATDVANHFGFNSKLYSFSSCPTIKNIYKQNRDHLCSDSTNWILNEISKEKYRNIVITNYPGYYYSENLNKLSFTNSNSSASEDELIEMWVNTVCEISQVSNVYLVRPIPVMDYSVPQFLSRKLIYSDEVQDVKVLVTDYHKKNKLFYLMQDEAVSKCDATILDPTEYLCDKDFCHGSLNGRPLYYDKHHLSEYGNTYLKDMFVPIFKSEKK